MPWFQCLIRGEDFPGLLLGRQGTIGFYATRVVEALSSEQAESRALAELQADGRLDVPESERTDQARVYFERITELPERPDRMPDGFTFYAVDV